MPEDYVQKIAERVAEIAKKVVETQSPVRVGTVLSVNPDGSVNVDDGQGGCAIVSNVGTQVVTCGSTVMLGLEPKVGNTTDLCQVQFAINSSSKGCPIETREDEQEAAVLTGFVFVDNSGNIYSYETGELLALGVQFAGGHPPAGWSGAYNGFAYPAMEGDISYGYSYDVGAGATALNYAGALVDDGQPLDTPPNYADLVIGNYDSAPFNDGYQGSNYTIIGNSCYLGRLVLGQGASSDRLVGMEIVNDAAGNHGPNWRVNCRQLSDFSLLWETAATYLSDWVTSFFYDDAVTFGPTISADADGSFWVTIQNGLTSGDKGPNPMFNISAADGSLIRTVELATPEDTDVSFYHASPVVIQG
jgi:hypothetical protein